MLTTDDVARVLGVKKATVYAYVSRGLLASRRHGGGKESVFRETDVRAFAGQRRRAGTSFDGSETPVTHTGITLITGDRLYYRGFEATALARRESYESVASLLWTGRLEHAAFGADSNLRTVAAAVTGPLPEAACLTDRLRVIVAAAGATDPLRFDTSPAAVVATGRTLLDTMVAALPSLGSEPRVPGGFPLAGALWERLSAAAPTEDGIAALNAALVLLADHDLAASTYAARVAASTRADPYAVVSAGLATLAGPLHGAASGLAVEMLAIAIRTGDVVGTISDRLRSGGSVPGFGHPLYSGVDPRAVALLDVTAKAGDDEQALSVIADVAEAMRSRAGIEPNVDFALAALSLLTGMRPDAGETIFAIARTAGWLAHAMEEYANPPSRFRPTARYAGRPPGE
ncbi:citrate synthase [Actinoplanes sp. TFC3]|uniref:citrate synthase n=1 Tax=Actinoplanes sp. TFC3 TaxID=1710355 RepID=UPI000831CBA5|nr:citrate synthase [Actinoplanes sp. TFC3]